jgi:hypothetical protein
MAGRMVASMVAWKAVKMVFSMVACLGELLAV